MESDIEKWIFRYYETVRQFYKQGLGSASCSLSQEQSFIMDIYRQHHAISYENALLLQMAAVMAIRSQVIDYHQFIDCGEDVLNRTLSQLALQYKDTSQTISDAVKERCKKRWNQNFDTFFKKTIELVKNDYDIKVFPPKEMAESQFVQRFCILNTLLEMDIVRDKEPYIRLYKSAFKEMANRDVESWFSRKMSKQIETPTTVNRIVSLDVTQELQPTSGPLDKSFQVQLFPTLKKKTKCFVEFKFFSLPHTHTHTRYNL